MRRMQRRGAWNGSLHRWAVAAYDIERSNVADHADSQKTWFVKRVELKIHTKEVVTFLYKTPC